MAAKNMTVAADEIAKADVPGGRRARRSAIAQTVSVTDCAIGRPEHQPCPPRRRLRHVVVKLVGLPCFLSLDSSSGFGLRIRAK